MPKNKLEDLRNHLFETLEALKDDDKPMDLDRARRIVDVAEAIIDSGRVEIEMIRATDALMTTEFFGQLEAKSPDERKRLAFEDPRKQPRLTNGHTEAKAR